MLPTLSPRDIVIYKPIKPGDKSLKNGCLVVIKHPNQPNNLIVKRVYKKNSFGIELRGDNKLESTDSRHFGLINYTHIYGLVEEIIQIKD